MFGYIIVNKAEMKFKEFDVYQSYYCGLCRSLKDKYGMLGQMTLNYDMTFVYILLSSLYEPETKFLDTKCVIHPFEKHCVRTNFISEYIADMNVLMSYYKCMDDWEDNRNPYKLMFGKLLEGKACDRPRIYQDKIKTINILMHDLKIAELENKQEIDTMAGLFGNVMSNIVSCREDEWTETLQRLGFYLGKFIYLLDAYEDIEEDIKKHRFNPLLNKYDSPDFEEDCRIILMMMMSECCKEFEKLPILENVEILRNILYSGVWTRYELVRGKRSHDSKKGI